MNGRMIVVKLRGGRGTRVGTLPTLVRVRLRVLLDSSLPWDAVSPVLSCPVRPDPLIHA